MSIIDKSPEADAPSAPIIVSARPTTAERVRRILFTQGIYIILIALVVLATIVYPGFLSGDNLLLLLQQNVPLGIVAVGMTVVLIGGGFDLSVGASFALAGVLSAQIAQGGNVPLGIAAGIIAGFACGVFNGFVVTGLGVNPFVATLGSSTLIGGATLLYTNSQSYSVPDPAFKFLGTGTIGPVPISVILLVVVFAVAYLVLRATIYGRALFAVGGNKEASRLYGLRTNLVQGSTYVISGTLAGVAGVLSASQLSVGQGSAGATLALNAIAVVVIGGTSLTGGEGSVLRTGIGLLILAILQNIYFSLAINTYWQLITQGAIVIGAVTLDRWQRRTT